MPRPPSIQWYYKQYLGDNKVLAMDWDARGMHVHLLNLAIQEEPPGSIPDDMAKIRRWLGLTPGTSDADAVWNRVRPQMFAAWSLRDGRWFNSGLVATFDRQTRYRERYQTGTKSTPDLQKTEHSTAFEVDVGSNKPKDSDELIERIVRLHPANWHLRNELQLPQAHLSVVIQAVERSGAEKVENGTRICAEVAKTLTDQQRKFIPGLVKFFSTEAHYLKTREDWERLNDRQLSKSEQRINQRRTNIVNAFRKDVGRNVGCSDGEPRDSSVGGTHPGISGRVLKASSSGD